MSTNENNSEVAVDKVGDEKTGDAKSDLKGAKRAAEVSAHVKLNVFILSARHFIERLQYRVKLIRSNLKTIIKVPRGY